jgi:DNA helicase HerA-like ATPase
MDLSKVRIREHFGIITNDTRTAEFSFVVSPPKNRSSLEKQDYIVVDHPLFGEACQVIGVIKEITSYEEVTGSTIGDRIGRMLATTEIIGFVDLRKQTRPLRKLLAPPNPGSRVYVPLLSFLEETLNRNSKGEPYAQPVCIGKLEGAAIGDEQAQNQISCFLDAQELTTKHTLITAMPGAGKTQTAKRLIQEISTKANSPIVIFDPAGEYVDLQLSKSQIVVIAAKPDTVSKKILDKKTQVKNLSDINKPEALAKEVKPGQITVMNCQGLTMEEKNSSYTECLEALRRGRIDEIIEPFLLLVEDAENLKGETLSHIVSDGRKNGIAICLITTHPTELGGRILSQVCNQIIGKTTDKSDVDYFTNATNAGSGTLPNLVAGEWIVTGVNLSRPLKVQTRE